MKRLGLIARGLVALIATLLILVGAPMLLAFFSSSIVPDQGVIQAIIRPDYTGGLLIHTILPAIGWIAWATFALAILLEIPSAFTKIKVPAVPGLQVQRKAAAALLGAITIGISALFGAGGAMAAEPAAADTAPVSVSAHADPDHAKGSAQTTTKDEKYTIEQGDSLWKIADDKYGNPDRYTDIVDANDLSNPDVLHAGETLVVPDVEVNEPAPEPAPVPKSESDSPDSANSSSASNADNVEKPAPTVDEGDDVDKAASDDESALSPSLITTAGVGTLLAAGLIGVLAAKRKRQRAKRTPGKRTAQPALDASKVELELREVEDPANIAHIDSTLRWLASYCRRVGKAMPQPFAGRLSTDGVELYLTESADFPAPMRKAAEDGTAWVVDTDKTPTVDDDAEIPAPWPTMSTIGIDEAGGQVLIDLESTGALNIVGNEAPNILLALCLELGVSPWADDLQMTLVGMDDDLPTLIGPGKCRTLNDVDELIRILTHRKADAQAALADDDAADIADARTRGLAPDTWTPEIVFIGHDLSANQAQQLADLVGQLPRTGLAIASTSPLGVGWTLTVTEETAVLDPAGITVTPQRISTDQYTALRDLYSTADDFTEEEGPQWSATMSVTPDILSPVSLPQAPELDDSPVLASADNGQVGESDDQSSIALPTPPEEITDAVPEDVVAADIIRVSPKMPVIRLLGQVRIIGAKGPEPVFNSGSSRIGICTAMAAYLATHPGVHRESIHTSLWPKADTQDGKYSRLNAPISSLRKWLAEADDGAPNFPSYSAAEGYRLHPDVQTDWHVVQGLLGDSIAETPTARLSQALRLVDGPPISGLPPARKFGSSWAWAEPLREEIIQTLTDIAHEIAARCLTTKDYATARVALATAKMVGPEHEFLWRDSLLIEHAAGNHDKVAEIISTLTNDDSDVDVDLTDETEDLIDQIRKAG